MKQARYKTLAGAENYAQELRTRYPDRQFVVTAYQGSWHTADFNGGYTVQMWTGSRYVPAARRPANFNSTTYLTR